MPVTPHISEPPIPYAETVLMPGDPLRSKFIADNFLESPVLVNNVRGIQGYTGYYNGKKVSVMASGMGVPSIAIYSHELYTQFGVENIIRIGSMGSFREDLPVRSVVLALAASTDSSFISQYNLPGTFCPCADWDLINSAYHKGTELGIRCRVGNILTTDAFYGENPEVNAKWTKMGLLGVEMESAGLYAIAARLGKKALSILTVSDHLVTGEVLPSEERRTTFRSAVKIALEIA